MTAASLVAGTGPTSPALLAACGSALLGLVLGWVVHVPVDRRWPPEGRTTRWRHPLVAGTTGLLFGLVTLVEGVTWLLPPLLVTTLALVVATVIDLEHRIIPNRMTYPLPFVLLLLLLPPTLRGPGSGDDLVRGLVAAVVVPAGFLLVAELYRLLRGVSGFGMGDVKLLVSLGLVCGYLGWFEVAVLLYGALVAAAVVAVVLLVTRRAGLVSRIPFGPYLAAGAMLAILLGDVLEQPVLGWLGLA